MKISKDPDPVPIGFTFPAGQRSLYDGLYTWTDDICLLACLTSQSRPKALTAPIEPPDLVWQRLTWSCGGQKHYLQPWETWSFIGWMSTIRTARAVPWRAECLIEGQLNPCRNLLYSWVSPIICHENIKYWNNCDKKGCRNISQRSMASLLFTCLMFT